MRDFETVIKNEYVYVRWTKNKGRCTVVREYKRRISLEDSDFKMVEALTIPKKQIGKLLIILQWVVVGNKKDKKPKCTNFKVFKRREKIYIRYRNKHYWLQSAEGEELCKILFAVINKRVK